MQLDPQKKYLYASVCAILSNCTHDMTFQKIVGEKQTAFPAELFAHKLYHFSYFSKYTVYKMLYALML